MNSEEIPLAFITHASEILGDTSLGLSGSKIISLCGSYALEANIRIPHEAYPFPSTNMSKRTVLRENIQAFPPQWQYKIIKELCENPSIQSAQQSEANKLKIQLLTRYSNFDNEILSENLNQALVDNTKHWLSAFPKSLELYNSALQKHEHGVFNRNVLDDLRLSLETLLHSLLENHKSLENQLSSVGTFVKSRNGSTEMVNMLAKLLDYYTKYQNTYIKHDSAVVEEEIEFVFEISSCFMRHLIRIYSKSAG